MRLLCRKYFLDRDYAFVSGVDQRLLHFVDLVFVVDSGDPVISPVNFIRQCSDHFRYLGHLGYLYVTDVT